MRSAAPRHQLGRLAIRCRDATAGEHQRLDRNYRRLFAGQSVSFIGDGITPVAPAFAVLDLTGSVAKLSTAAACTIPN
jgi:hypothetical protein